MHINRRNFIQILAAASAACILPRSPVQSAGAGLYDIENFGDVRLLHITDSHAQLHPVYYREPHTHIGGAPQNLTGQALLDFYGFQASSIEAYAFTHLNFVELAEKYGKVGGYAQLKTLIDQLRGTFGNERCLLLDGGDSWQGSGTALWTRGKEMVTANNLLGVDIATGHWEFTYSPEEVQENLKASASEFIAQNIFLTEEAQFEDKPAYDSFSGRVFPPYTIRSLGNFEIAIIGQAFPYTPIANPSRLVPDWTFGIRVEELQKLVTEVRNTDKPDAVVLLSHNGMAIDLKLASMVTGIDAILGGHTHDAVPKAIPVSNSKGTTLVTNAGSNGKFLGVLDIAFGKRGVQEMNYQLLPVFSNYLKPDAEMQSFIDASRRKYSKILEEPLAETESLLFRRGNFNGTFDEIICSALQTVGDTQIAWSPGFRWGTAVMPGQKIFMEDLLSMTAITYPEIYIREMSGEALKQGLEDLASSIFNPDYFHHTGGDMVRLSGLAYAIEPSAATGSRISEMRLDNGELIEAKKRYTVTGWASVGEVSDLPPVWDVVAEYLRSEGTVKVATTYKPRLLLKRDNPGWADY